MKIAISNGHGLKTAGKRTPAFPSTGKVIHEWEFNHATAKILQKILESQGYTVLMVSDTPDDTSLTKRINMANNEKCDMYMSIHYNAYQSIWGAHGGIETLYNPKSQDAKRLSTLVQGELIKATGLRDRGIKPRTDLGELNSTKMVATLVECGFMDNLKEASLMLDVKYQNTCANAIAKGINAYYGKANPIVSQTNGDDYMIYKTKINLNGKIKEVDAINQNGNNYVKLQDLRDEKIIIDYDSVAKVPVIKVK